MIEKLHKAAAVWREARAADKERPKIKRQKDELDFLPAAVEVLETPASPLGRTFALLIAFMFMVTIIWAMVGEIDTVAVAQGKIIPGGRVKMIQPLEAGIVRAIRVEDGQRVRKGQVLVELDPTETGADRERLERTLVAARLDGARLSALISKSDNPVVVFTPPAGVDKTMVAASTALMVAQADEFRESLATFKAEIRQRQAQLSTTRARMAKFRDTLPLLKKRVKAWAYLAKKEYASRLRLTELEEQLIGRQRDMTIEKRQLVEIRESISVLKRRRAERKAAFVSQINTDLADALQRADGSQKDLIKALQRDRRQALRAPVDGTVQQLAIHTIGGVVQPAQQLMIVVPEGSKLEIEAKVLNKDIGFVHADQEVAIKVESFPFTKFGLIPGTVHQLSADAVQDENLGLIYPARITMHENRILVKDRWVKLAPGMSVTAEVKTGKRRAIEFFLSPLLKYQNEAMRER